MSEADSKRDPVEQLAEEFLERLRSGHWPSMSEYASRYPEHAEAIRELFPVLVALEGARPDPHDTHAGGKPVETFGATIPQRFGDYRIIREIGRGGMGLVYEAEQESLGRRVALKVLPLHASMAGTAVERFRREAQAAARLHHTNIVPVFDVGQEGPTCYYAMQYIHGAPLDLLINRLRQTQTESRRDETPAMSPPAISLQDLTASLLAGHFDGAATSTDPMRAPDEDLDALTTPHITSAGTRPVGGASTSTNGGTRVEGGRRLRSAPDHTSLPPAQSRTYFESVARLGYQVADALAYAHAKGVIHRDIKPSNLLLDSSGVAWVTDFGMVKVDGESLTLTGDILGTLRYMAPERFKGQCDARADVYALGLTLYELLILKPAFEAPDRLRLMELIATKSPPPPRQINRRIPRDLETIVAKSIEKDPNRRYSSARALSEDLQRFLSDRPILARPVGPVERLLRWSRRNPTVSALVATIALMLLTVAAMSMIAAYRFQLIADSERIAKEVEKESRTEAVKSRIHAEEKERQANQRAEDLRRHDYVNRVNLAYHESRYDNVARAQEMLEGCPDDLRGWEWNYVRNQSEVSLRSWQEQGMSVNSVAFHPDGTRLAIGTGNFANRFGEVGDLIVRNIKTGETEFEQRALADGVNVVAFSRDGKRLAAGHGLHLQVWDIDTGRELFAHRGDRSVVTLAFSPDGRMLVAGFGTLNASDAGSIVIYDAQTGAPLGDPLPGRAGGVWSVAFHPDGHQLAVTSEGIVEIWDLTSRQVLKQLRDEEGFLYAVAWHPNGRYVAAGGLNRTIRLWDAATGELVRTYLGHAGIIRALAFSPDGLMASASEDKSIRLWELESERETAIFHGHSHFVHALSFSDDGYVLASGSLDQTVKLWFASPDHQLTYRGHERQGHVRSVAFSPLGNAIASGAYYFSGDNDRLHLWDPNTGQMLVEFPQNVGDVTAVAFSPDATQIASGHPDGTIGIWQARDGTLLARLVGHVGPVWDVKFSADGLQLASGGQDGAVNLWDAESGTLVRSIFAHLESVRAIEFSPSGQRIASASSDGTVKVWDTATGNLKQTFSEHKGTVWSLAFSLDGNSIASAGGVTHRSGEVRVWDVDSRKELYRPLLGHTDVVFDVAFSPDGDRIATASDDRTIKLWDAHTGEEIFTLRGHAGGVTCVAFSPNGQQIVSGSVDRTAQVWSVKAPSESARYQRHIARFLERAEGEILAGNWNEAVQLLDRVSKHGIDDPRAKTYRALAALQLQASDPGDGLPEIVKATVGSVHDAKLLLRWAGDLVRFGHEQAARAAVARAIQLEPRNQDAHSMAARLQASAGQSDEALTAFEQAMSFDRAIATGDDEGESTWFETGWWAAGPFDGRLQEAGPPESAASPLWPGKHVAESGDRSQADWRWVPVVAQGDGYIDLRPLAARDQVAAYAIEHVYSPLEQTVALLIRADDSTRVWLDGTLVVDRRRRIDGRIVDDAIPVNLSPGWHTVLVKVANERGPHGMYVNLSRRSTDLARAHLGKQDLDAVLRVWENAADEVRQERQMLALAGEAFARRGKWQEAAEIFRQLVQSQPVRNRNWTMLAPLLLQLGDVQVYREHCQAMVEAFGASKLPITLERTAKACLLMSDEPARLQAPIEMASRAASLGADHSFVAYFCLADGIGRFRLGDYREAAELLQRAQKLDGDRDPYVSTTAFCFLAMASHRQGEMEDALRFMAEADAAFAQRLPSLAAGDLGPAWPDWLICEIARREASTMLGVSAEVR